ncbi:beta-ketoacyl-ACP synthase II [Coxiella burnetii]|uniref:3-oxoacyl-[acyl-carrier-protein] synthase 2 n=1 Tax=Coxiella burnetii (strain RSA 493 / Nine Mile phase I) TaxID=227377 RepID=FABF_COXBU|nr:beta-ketoacyl-ACP synthase II [Coxiella burnetii]NP_819531.1 3-oxoacyl-[acyl-carrier-protein] synthase [Coxiella burnetii RSA 493]Q83E37.1 RecName: Full=3-oxoacyl-[acyl-carrier-protein] synthase 2; AltName: Full=3-oxoacyl-[acyl-carrier-protein] synthase II; AltName: Full=Beta-ketoacyl-ACP synthase II; Short=KAS II [Coxiella burnetii RSA 493]AAO90045.1 3-oxoacyl-[acyl-carrier-protein] synthase [Coxiella burnetii RSA 493]ABX77618.1 3-oxoacyl-[acyl-carrier-protein] synthase 2 [Coxiella burnetii
MEKRRVVITGLGVVSPLGNKVSDMWQALLAGKSGVKPITRFDASSFPTQIAAEVRDFDPALVLDLKSIRKTDVFVQFAMESARQAWEDSGLEINETNAPRVGVAIGSGIGGMPWIEKNYDALLTSGPRKISPFFIPGAIINMASGMVSIKYDLKGPNISIVTACTTGLHNIGHAARMIAHNDADAMIAGGTEMASTPLGIGGFAAVRALSTRNDEPEKASRPWDKGRDGFVLGEGAACVVVEELEHAKKRNATIYAEIIGFGMSGDAYHMTRPDPEAEGFTTCMKNSLRDAGIAPERVDYINAHGTSTPAADPLEARAIKKTFGDHAYKLAVSSTKSMTGHMLGAAGALETVISVLAIRDNTAPPTINLENPDEGCDLDFVPNEAREMKIDTVMSNSFGFGGTNGTLVLSRVFD